MRAILLAIAVTPFLLVASGADVGHGITAQFTATALTTTAGVGDASLRLILNQDSGGAASPAGFVLRAESLTIETDRTEALVAGSLYIGSQTLPPRTLNDAMLSSTATREGFRLVVLPLGDASARATNPSGCLDVQPTERAFQIVRPLVEQSRSTMSIDLQDAVRATPCPGQDTVIRGDFLLVLYEWDAEVTHADGAETLRSGRESYTPPSLLDSSAVMAAAQEQYLIASNATLTIPYHETAAQYVSSLAVAVDGTATWLGVSGRIAEADVQADQVETDGTLDIHLQSAGPGKPLKATLVGDIDRVAVDGREIDVQSTTTDPTRSWPDQMWLASAGVAALAVWAALRATRRRRVQWHLRAAVVHFEGNSMRRALARASRAVRIAPARVQPRLVRAAAYDALEQPRQALKDREAAHSFLEGGQATSPEMVVENAVAAAQSCLALQDGPGAANWLRKAAGADEDLTRSRLLASDRRPLQGYMSHVKAQFDGYS